MMVQIALIVLFSVLTGVGWVLAVRSQPRYRREQGECCHALGLTVRVEDLEERERKLEERVRKLEEKGEASRVNP